MYYIPDHNAILHVYVYIYIYIYIYILTNIGEIVSQSSLNHTAFRPLFQELYFLGNIFLNTLESKQESSVNT
jgi:hypothetical protein